MTYARFKFFEKLSSSNQSEVYLKFCKFDSVCALKFIFCLNKIFSKALSFEHSMNFVRQNVPEIYLFEVLLKKVGT